MIATIRRIATALLLVAMVQNASAADFTIRNLDAGSTAGLSDTRRVAPIDGNTGTTLGEQRRIALRYAVRIVTSRLVSPVPIRIDARVDSDNPELSCRRNAATLGLGGATNYTANFPGAPQRDVLYPLALANALAGQRLAQGADARLFMNGKLDAGASDCLRGATWYYGLNGTPGNNQIDFVHTAVHELIHGMGFQAIVSLTDTGDRRQGAYPVFRPGQRFPSVFDLYPQDLSMTGQPRFPQLTVARRANALNHAPFVVWSSAITNAATTNFLTAGRQAGRIRLFAPEVVLPASSISHWSALVEPDQIMEPFESVETSVLNGLGLASCALRDIGWQLADGVHCPDTQTATIVGTARGQYVRAFAEPATPAPRAAERPATESDDDDDGGSGGGCTMAPGQAFDPVWLVLCVLAAGVLMVRRNGQGRV